MKYAGGERIDDAYGNHQQHKQNNRRKPALLVLLRRLRSGSAVRMVGSRMLMIGVARCGVALDRPRRREPIGVAVRLSLPEHIRHRTFLEDERCGLGAMLVGPAGYIWHQGHHRSLAYLIRARYRA